MLDQMYQAYGKPLEFEFKNVERGKRTYANGESKDMFKVWYAARTTKEKRGYLFVEVVQDAQQATFSSFSLVQFQSDIPENLR